MQAIKLCILLLLLGAFGVGNVWADRGRAHFSVIVGPSWGPWYYPPPAYYYPPYYPQVVIQPPVPQVYIEQPQNLSAIPPASAAAEPSNYWYYCASTRAYYPYVKECPGGWQRVTPQPPAQP